MASGVSGSGGGGTRAPRAPVDFRRWPPEVLACLRRHLPESLLDVVLGGDAGSASSMHPGAWYLSRGKSRLIDALCRRCQTFLGAPNTQKLRECLDGRGEAGVGARRGVAAGTASAPASGRPPETRWEAHRRGAMGPSPATRGASRVPGRATRDTPGAQRRSPRTGAGGDAPAHMPVCSIEDIQLAREAALDAARRAGASAASRTRAATVVSELARNIVLYAGEGRVRLQVSPRGLRVEAEDEGPGIDRLEEILSGAYRSKTGMGLGLLGTKRLAEEFHVDTEVGRGTRVRALILLR